MKRISYFLLFAFILAACSTSKPKTEEATDATGGTPTSAADEVGSTPEDLLTDEKGGEEGANADPFADIKDGQPAKEESTIEPSTQETLTKSTPVEEQKVETIKSSDGQEDVYTVKAGDTLMKIAFSIYGDLSRWHDLYVWNQAKIGHANELKRGMKLTFMAPTEQVAQEQHSHSYKIKKGDTLAGIADEVYGRRMKYRKLQRYNPQLIKDPHKIFAGFTIFYEITPQEMAEAEARRREKMAGTPAPAAAPSPAAPPAPPASSSSVFPPDRREAISRPDAPAPAPSRDSFSHEPAQAPSANSMVPSDAPVAPTMPK
jgi:nucleoid-associated protein YgaU